MVKVLESPTCWGYHARNPNKFGNPVRHYTNSQRPDFLQYTRPHTKVKKYLLNIILGRCVEQIANLPY